MLIISGKHVLVLWASGGKIDHTKPLFVSLKETKNTLLIIRKASSTVRASQDEERELVELSAKVPFDDRINQRATINDLRVQLIRAHLSEIGSELFDEYARIKVTDLCKRMKIIDGPKQHLQPRNVGLLFSNEKPDNFYPPTQIDVVQLLKALAVM